MLEAPARSLTFAPSGLAITAAVGEQAVSWDALTGREIGRFAARTGTLSGYTYCADGQWLAAAAQNGEVTFWPVVRREDAVALRGFTEAIRGLEVSSDGRRLLCITGEPSFKLWDAQTFQPLLTIATGEVPLVAGGFSVDGQTMFSLNRLGKVQVWDPATGDAIGSIATGAKDPGWLAISAGGQLAVGGAGGKVEIWDAARRQLVTAFEVAGGLVQSVRFSPDGHKLAAATADHAIRFLDARAGVELLALRGHTGPVLDLAFTKDGQRLLSASVDQTARAWDLGNGQELLVLRGHTGPVRTVTLTPDGKRIVTGGQDGTLRVWDATTGTAFLTLPAGAAVHAATFTPDGKRLLTGSDKSVLVWAGE
jgi:WD40 repeat protein